MAGDWIKIREDLHEDPAVLQMASELDTRPEHVVGYCVRFWAWVSRNCHGGSVTGVTLVSLESVINLPGFCDLLCKVGWLEYDDSGGAPVIGIPHFERHLSQGSKERALAANRQKSSRKKRHGDSEQTSRSERDKSVTREEKRRGNTQAAVPNGQPPVYSSSGNGEQTSSVAAGQGGKKPPAARSSGRKKNPADDVRKRIIEIAKRHACNQSYGNLTAAREEVGVELLSLLVANEWKLSDFAQDKCPVTQAQFRKVYNV